MNKIGFIGGGNMANAIIQGILHKNFLPASQIAVCDHNPAKCEAFLARGIAIQPDEIAVVKDAKYIVLAVKPQGLPPVLQAIAPYMRPEHVVISIVAGMSSLYLRQMLGQSCKVVVVMPNTPLMLGAGACAISRTDGVLEEEFQFVREAFGCGGIVEEIAESLQNTSIAVHGSTPAFLYLFAKTIINYAAKLGMQEETAKNLFCQTMIGAAKMLLESGKEPQALIDMVCSKGGTTLKGLEALENGRFCQTIEQAMDACIQRAKELGK